MIVFGDFNINLDSETPHPLIDIQDILNLNIIDHQNRFTTIGGTTTYIRSFFLDF